mmetsp:Transcript_14147/g.40087  ORF Transcript_14147/g.40087 Transcript_14147/m.40087 type:complete len:271 (-) Transcript_14147:427-1239(-)
MSLMLCAESLARSTLLSTTKSTSRSAPTMSCLGTAPSKSNATFFLLLRVLNVTSLSTAGAPDPASLDFAFGDGDASSLGGGPPWSNLLFWGLTMTTRSSSPPPGACRPLSSWVCWSPAKCLEMASSLRLVSSMKAWIVPVFGRTGGALDCTPCTICLWSSLWTACIRSSLRPSSMAPLGLAPPALALAPLESASSLRAAPDVGTTTTLSKFLTTEAAAPGFAGTCGSVFRKEAPTSRKRFCRPSRRGSLASSSSFDAIMGTSLIFSSASA